ncbi:MAG: Fe-S cluster assembly protein SufD, partial [Anaeromyxobacteraceae bacterium]
MTRAEESFEKLLAVHARGEPGFVAAHRAEGAATFRRLKLPTTRHEEWKYTSLAGLSHLELRRAAPAV